MIIAIEICQDNFIYCKIWTQNLDVKTSKKPKETNEAFYFQFPFWHMGHAHAYKRFTLLHHILIMSEIGSYQLTGSIN